MKMHDMKRTDKDKRAHDKEMTSSPMDGENDYGMRLHMGDDDLDKAKVKDTPEHGEVFHFEGHAKVHRSNESTDSQGGHRHVEMHITRFGMEPHGKPKERSIRDELEDADKASEKRADGKTRDKGDKEEDGAREKPRGEDGAKK